MLIAFRYQCRCLHSTLLSGYIGHGSHASWPVQKSALYFSLSPVAVRRQCDQLTMWSIAPTIPQILWAQFLLEENTILCSACTLLWVGRGVQRIASSSWLPSLYHIMISAICKLSWLPNLIRCYISPLHHLPFLGSHLSSYPLTGKIFDYFGEKIVMSVNLFITSWTL